MSYQATSKRSCTVADPAACQASPQQWFYERRIDFICGCDMLCNVLVYLRLPEMPAVWRAARSLRCYYESEQLWQELYARRCWEGITKCHRARGPRMYVDNSWRSLYRLGLREEAHHVPSFMVHLKQLVPGVHGYLSQFIGVNDEAYRNAAGCALRRNPIVAENFEAAATCIKQIRALFEWQDAQTLPQWYSLRAAAKGNDDEQEDSSLVETAERALEKLREACLLNRVPEPNKIVVVTVDASWEDDELDVKLARLRNMAGTCMPLLDCLRCQADCKVDQHKLMIALRKEIGPIAVCDGVAEAERVIATERCDVICCGGTRLAEYQECWIPEVVWREWPSGQQIWEP